jgi:Kdo2-lipid IVA lauroyltransferase/acyltransferase
MLAGGRNAGVPMPPTELKGVEQLLRVLKHSETIALPPDLAPNSMGRACAEFFGRPAYTRTKYA